MNQIQPENTLSIDELNEANASSYGLAIGSLVLQKLSLEKQVQVLQAHIAEVEAANVSLKAENSNLITAHIKLEGHIHSLEKELEGRPTPEQLQQLQDEIVQLIEAGPTLAQSAAHGIATTEARKEKAAPD